MSKLFTLRKDSGDEMFPWALRDLNCSNKGEHSFSGYNDPECDGKCDAFSTGTSALIWMNVYGVGND